MTTPTPERTEVIMTVTALTTAVSVVLPVLATLFLLIPLREYLRVIQEEGRT